MSNDASGIQDELTVELVKGVEIDTESSLSSSEQTDVDPNDGLISVDQNVLAHLLNFHNSCNGCNLNAILNRLNV